jgi:hypothetical protein
MSLNLTEEFKVLDYSYGIEDFKSPGEHFFDGLTGIGGKPLPRFMLWTGGCVIGHFEDLKEAREYLFDYIRMEFRRKRAEAKAAFDRSNKILEKLGNDPLNLGQFKAKRKTR